MPAWCIQLGRIPCTVGLPGLGYQPVNRLVLAEPEGYQLTGSSHMQVNVCCEAGRQYILHADDNTLGCVYVSSRLWPNMTLSGDPAPRAVDLLPGWYGGMGHPLHVATLHAGSDDSGPTGRGTSMIWNWETCDEFAGGNKHSSMSLRAHASFPLLSNVSHTNAVHLSSSLPRVWLPAAIRCDPTRLERLGPAVWHWMAAPCFRPRPR